MGSRLIISANVKDKKEDLYEDEKVKDQRRAKGGMKGWRKITTTKVKQGRKMR